MANFWRYFRLDGDPPIFGGADVFTVAIHHGGRFHSNGGLNRVYRTIEPVVYVDGVDPDKLSLTGFNYWASDLGYEGGPIGYWFRIPGSEEGTGYLPVTNDADAMDMVQFIPANGRTLHVYIVCLQPRREFQEWELEGYADEVDHLSYFGHVIEDLPLSDNDALPEVEKEMAEVKMDPKEDDDDVDEPPLREESRPAVEPMVDLDMDSIFNNEQLMEHIFGTSSGPTQTEDMGNGPNNATQHGPSATQNGPRTRSRAGIQIMEPTDGPARSAPTSKKATDKGKGKQKVVEQPKKKPGRARKQRPYNTRSGGECSRPIPEADFSDDDSSDSSDSNFDGIVDSDYELDEQDDGDMFYSHVDGDTMGVPECEEMGFEGNISDAGPEGDDSDGFTSAHESDSEGNDVGPFRVKGKRRFSDWVEFNEKADMKTPRFCLGMVFPNSAVFKHAVRKHAVLTKKELRFPRNTKHQVLVRCKTSPDCPFWMYASSPDMHNPTLQIRTYRPNHTCSSIGKKVYHCHAPFLSEEYKEVFFADGKWTREGIQSAVIRDLGMEIGHQLAYRAKARAAKLAQGTLESQYNLLESYAHELKKRNPGSSVWIQTEPEGDVARFKRIYICIAALREGWMAGCRPIIGLDGCHLKGFHKGQLLSAVGIDGNNGMYPIAWAIVEQESRDSWTWFLTFLKEDLQIHHSSHYAFMSDKQKGLEQAVKDLFPDAEHRFCVRHMHNNFKLDGNIGLELKQRFWAIARATTMIQYEKAMEVMQQTSFKAWQWCLDRPRNHWSKSHFQEKFQCDILLNNHSESFNKSILEARKKPILPCLEDIRVACMVRLATRRNSAAKWRCKVGPRIEKLFKKNAAWATDYRPLESSNFRFELQGRGVGCESGVIAQHSVQLDTKSCTCRRWNLCGLPCGHAISAIYSKGWSPDDYVSEWYTQAKYMQAYEVTINPIAGVAEWERIERAIAPPLYRRQPGRPKTKRTKEPGEAPPPPGIEKLPKSYYSQVNCGICHQKGHNRRTCQQRNQVPNVNEGVEEAAMPDINPPQPQPPNEEQPPTEEQPPNGQRPPTEEQPPNEATQPTEESNVHTADNVKSQASTEPLSFNNGSHNGHDNVNVNVNVNLNVHVSMNEEGGPDNDSSMPSQQSNVVQPNSQDPSVAHTSSKKRYKRTAGRIKPRKSPRLAALADKGSQNVPANKKQVQRRLWKP